jgi:hypothetical protein
MRLPSWQEKDSFELQSGQMADVDAHAELLKRVRTVRGMVGVPHELVADIETETTKDGYNKIIRVTQKPSKPISIEELFKASFLAWRVLQEIEAMLDPNDRRGFWRLYLKQRRTGKRTVPAAIVESIYSDYAGARCYETETPIKVIIGRLAQEYGVSDAAIREIVRRKHGKKSKPKLGR